MLLLLELLFLLCLLLLLVYEQQFLLLLLELLLEMLLVQQLWGVRRRWLGRGRDAWVHGRCLPILCGRGEVVLFAVSGPVYLRFGFGGEF